MVTAGVMSHTTHELLNKGSTEISKAEHGLFKSNFVTTSGCSTPIFPIGFPLNITVAQRPWKYVGSKIIKREKFYHMKSIKECPFHSINYIFNNTCIRFDIQ